MSYTVLSVLGKRLQDDRLTAEYDARIRTAARRFVREGARTVLFSGGIVGDGCVSEALAGARHFVSILADAGIQEIAETNGGLGHDEGDAWRIATHLRCRAGQRRLREANIALDVRSRDTDENLYQIVDHIVAAGEPMATCRLLVVTSGYHAVRGRTALLRMHHPASLWRAMEAGLVLSFARAPFPPQCTDDPVTRWCTEVYLCADKFELMRTNAAALVAPDRLVDRIVPANVRDFGTALRAIAGLVAAVPPQCEKTARFVTEQFPRIEDGYLWLLQLSAKGALSDDDVQALNWEFDRANEAGLYSCCRRINLAVDIDRPLEQSSVGR